MARSYLSVREEFTGFERWVPRLLQGFGWSAHRCLLDTPRPIPDPVLGSAGSAVDRKETQALSLGWASPHGVMRGQPWLGGCCRGGGGQGRRLQEGGRRMGVHANIQRQGAWWYRSHGPVLESGGVVASVLHGGECHPGWRVRGFED